MSQKTKCIVCGREILQRTADRTGGLCRPCKRDRDFPPVPDSSPRPSEKWIDYVDVPEAIERLGLRDLKFGKLSKGELEELIIQFDRCHAALSLEELIALKLSGDKTTAIENTRIRHPSWTPEDARLNVALSDIGHAADWFARGLGIRFEDSTELSTGVCLNSRFHWIFYSDYKDGVNPWKLLQSIACRDSAIVDAYRETSKFPLEEGLAADRLFRNGILAAIRKDFAYLRSLESSLVRQDTTKWRRGVFTCLRGLASDSSTLVSDGLLQMVQFHRRQNTWTALERTVSVEAHGMYELCREISPRLVSDFNVERALPWDFEFYQWARRDEDPLENISFQSMSPEVHDVIIKLARPTWRD